MGDSINQKHTRTKKGTSSEVNNNKIITNICKFCILEERNKQWIIYSNLYIQNLKPQNR